MARKKQKQYCDKFNKDFKVDPEEETRGIIWGGGEGRVAAGVKQQIIHSTI